MQYNPTVECRLSFRFAVLLFREINSLNPSFKDEIFLKVIKLLSSESLSVILLYHINLNIDFR